MTVLLEALPISLHIQFIIHFSLKRLTRPAGSYKQSYINFCIISTFLEKTKCSFQGGAVIIKQLY